eukprot:GILJ01007911.1.p1 GENE.GILJ01007911.1~~GILJ01007911.1.p1  ORF type:complete len:1031 (-),score=134.64 GILJ01007911.1:150-3242(-)
MGQTESAPVPLLALPAPSYEPKPICGIFSKAGRRTGRTRLRFFVISNLGRLAYFRSQEALSKATNRFAGPVDLEKVKPEGIIDLEGCSLGPLRLNLEMDSLGNRTCFEVFCPTRTWGSLTIYAMDEESTETLARTFQRFQAPYLSASRINLVRRPSHLGAMEPEEEQDVHREDSSSYLRSTGESFAMKKSKLDFRHNEAHMAEDPWLSRRDSDLHSLDSEFSRKESQSLLEKSRLMTSELTSQALMEIDKKGRASMLDRLPLMIAAQQDMQEVSNPFDTAVEMTVEQPAVQQTQDATASRTQGARYSFSERESVFGLPEGPSQPQHNFSIKLKPESRRNQFPFRSSMPNLFEEEIPNEKSRALSLAIPAFGTSPPRKAGAPDILLSPPSFASPSLSVPTSASTASPVSFASPSPRKSPSRSAPTSPLLRSHTVGSIFEAKHAKTRTDNVANFCSNLPPSNSPPVPAAPSGSFSSPSTSPFKASPLYDELLVSTHPPATPPSTPVESRLASMNPFEFFSGLTVSPGTVSASARTPVLGHSRFHSVPSGTVIESDGIRTININTAQPSTITIETSQTATSINILPIIPSIAVHTTNAAQTTTSTAHSSPSIAVPAGASGHDLVDDRKQVAEGEEAGFITPRDDPLVGVDDEVAPGTATEGGLPTDLEQLHAADATQSDLQRTSSPHQVVLADSAVDEGAFSVQTIQLPLSQGEEPHESDDELEAYKDCVTVSDGRATPTACDAVKCMICGELISMDELGQHSDSCSLTIHEETAQPDVDSLIRANSTLLDDERLLLELRRSQEAELIRIAEEKAKVDAANGWFMPGAFWFMIDSKWLQKWRDSVGLTAHKFLGKSPSPGPITNTALLKADGHTKTSLRRGVKHDYEAVSYSVWEVYHRLYKGGPEIVRFCRTTETPTIYGEPVQWQGEWRHGRPWNGRGAFLDKETRIGFSGEMRDGHVWEGEGKVCFAGGNWFEGKIVQGRPDGKGKERRRDGSVYTGEFKDGMYHGHGLLTAPNGVKTEGEFQDGVLCGI